MASCDCGDKFTGLVCNITKKLGCEFHNETCYLNNCTDSDTAKDGFVCGLCPEGFVGDPAAICVENRM